MRMFSNFQFQKVTFIKSIKSLILKPVVFFRKNFIVIVAISRGIDHDRAISTFTCLRIICQNLDSSFSYTIRYTWTIKPVNF